ncbi:predicted protein [Arabidopsis lyrata subsp. lyrata]|uniref:Predicted protein n=1 Tax=Arabidopsis lyrata subsp. lyrata TaxID=81972 RepID=D7M7L9_ARALL|nr:predicted protein [Arabidopsis lyrata subsp. lyrata]
MDSKNASRRSRHSRPLEEPVRSQETDSSSLEEERARRNALEQRLVEQIALTEQMQRMIRDPRH